MAVTAPPWAGLPDHPHHDRARRYLPLGPGTVFSFGVRGGRNAGRAFIESVQLCSHLANVGEAQLRECGVPPDLVRISVGLEDPDDILWDLDLALSNAPRTGGPR